MYAQNWYMYKIHRNNLKTEGEISRTNHVHDVGQTERSKAKTMFQMKP